MLASFLVRQVLRHGLRPLFLLNGCGAAGIVSSDGAVGLGGICLSARVRAGGTIALVAGRNLGGGNMGCNGGLKLTV